MGSSLSDRTIVLIAIVVALLIVTFGGAMLITGAQGSSSANSAVIYGGFGNETYTVGLPRALPPAQINLSTDHVLLADGLDNITVTAVVTDAVGNPVSDGTEVVFTAGQTPWDAVYNGPLSTIPSHQGLMSIVARTEGGKAQVYYGWFNPGYAGNKSTISASLANSPAINSSLAVYAYKGLIWTGSVYDPYGEPYDNITVRLHLMGTDADGHDREISNLTAATPSEPEHPGFYVFDNITLPGNVHYGYAEALVDIGDGVIYYSRSDNVSLRATEGALPVSADIVLHVPMSGCINLMAYPEDTVFDHPFVDITEPVKYFDKYSTWGYTADSYGKPWSNATVTFHVLVNDSTGPERELYNLTTATSSDPQYPGAYAFIVPLNPKMTSAYVTAETQLQEGVILRGQSFKDEHPQVNCRHADGSITLNAPMPDSLRLSADRKTIGTGGQASVLAAQLMLNGRPYWRPGFNVSFSTDDDRIGSISGSHYNNTDNQGRAQIVIQSGNTSGYLPVYASAMYGKNTYLNRTCLLHVVGSQN